ncbi:arylsulfatase [Luteolibacter soli]|uniref:Arylsulfatase n=1 Tax=Luteolibacter soli TaxID=3135280 RepID=A0ABU9ATW2_9BACT
MRLTLALLFAGILTGHAQQVLFRDTFNRPDNRNIDAVLTGITNNTGTSLPVDGVYTQPFLDPNSRHPTYGAPDNDAGNGGGSQILSNAFQVKYGTGTANAYVNHNFTNAAILADGGFSVSLDVTAYSQSGASGQGGGFAIGMSQAEANATTDASVGTSRMTGAFGSAIGDPVASQVMSDFWIGIRGNNSLAWGGKSGVISGVTGLAAKTGTLSVNFTATSFNAGSTVGYEVFLNGVSKGIGTFTWSETNQNYIGIDGRDSSAVTVDNFTISTLAANPTVNLTAAPAIVQPDDTAETITLNWTATGLPPGATYQITADKAVSFPSGGNTGSAVNGSGSVQAIVNGTLGSTTFTFSVSNGLPAVIATGTATVSQAAPPSPRPNVIVILADDMGWGDLGCYGSEIPTPNIDALAANGVRFRQFYQSARCSPTRCSILTGLYPQQAAVDPSAALPNLRNDNNVTFAEMLGSQGYRTYHAGKWHLGSGNLLPESRGFQHTWRFANGTAHSADCWNQSLYTFVSQGNEIPTRTYGSEFHQTNAIGDYAVDFINHNYNKGDGKPFAMYLAFGAPHFPLSAPAEDADFFMDTYAQGWDVIRQQRYNRQLATGVIDSRYPFPALGGSGPHQTEPIVPIPAWDTLGATRKADLTRRMALYAAMIRNVDRNVGKVVTRLQQIGRLNNTMILFVSDNGANLEGGVYGANTALTGGDLTNMGQPGQNDGIHYGGGWAHVSNTPLKLFKHFTHEGGIRAPAILHWPDGFSAKGTWVETPAHMIDVMGSIVAATGATYPTTFNSHPVLPLEGTSLISMINGTAPNRTLSVEHESNRMIRKGKWKLVTEDFTAYDNEFTTNQKLLYDMDADPGESTDLAAQQPAKVVELVDEWNAWSTRVGLPASRLIVPAPLNVTPAATPADLFLDTFNRANSTDIDASNSGMSGSRTPPLGTGTTWFEGFEGSGSADSIQVADNVLSMANGVGMSENGLNHNFIGQDITDAGGFSVSLRVLSINTDATDTANRFAGFGVGLNATQAAGGNDIGSASPPPIRGNTGNPGTADCFLELDFNGNVKLWSDGVLRATVPVGKTSGTLTASFACNSFAAGATVTVSAYFDGTRLDLDSGSASMNRTFTWDEANANYLALSARASNYVQMDNFAVRKLPLSTAMSIEGALKAGLDGTDTSLTADPDGDGLDNFGEWAFGTNPAKADGQVAATSLVLVQPEAGNFRFAHRRLAGFAGAGLGYAYQASDNLSSWSPVTVTEESATPLPASPGYEVVTLSLSPSDLLNRDRLFLKIVAAP